MSKELTEQWRNGTLEDGFYYVKFPEEGVEMVNTYMLEQLALVRDADKIEVLAKVPDYVDYKEFEHTRECLKLSRDKVIRLQEQLKEANEVIKWYDGLENILIGWEICTGQPKGTAKNYLEKWGVK